MNSEKYIGLDVHQATIVVAVMDSTGKLVMESILETKAATILQFFAGLRGTLSVTFEEGTWSAWLYDLLNPHVDQLVVCNPRKNALLKDGNKSDRIDARKLAELVTRQSTQAGLPRRDGRADVAGTIPELSDHRQRPVAGDESAESGVSQLGDSLCRQRRVCTRYRAEWLAKIREAGVRRRAERLYQQLDMLRHLRQQAATRTVSGGAQACHHREAATDSLSGSDSIGAAGGPDPDAASFPYQATTVGLQRTGVRDSHQRGIPFRRRSTATLEETALHSRPE